jgi:hypothetical protein
MLDCRDNGDPLQLAFVKVVIGALFIPLAMVLSDGLKLKYGEPIFSSEHRIPPPIGSTLKKQATPAEENTIIVANINEIRDWLYYHITVFENIDRDIAKAQPFYELL